MLKVIAVVALVALAFPAYAAKCRSGKSILYTQDQYCPPGHTNITMELGGTVSTVGKSENVIQQEREYLNSRDAEKSLYRAQTAQAEQQAVQQNARNASLCASLADQARSLESAMRQPKGPQWLDNLKQQHRNVRDQQYRNKC